MRIRIITFVGLLLVAAAAAFCAPAAETATAQTAAGAATGELIVYNTPADYQAATGMQLAAYQEAPALAALVADGSLPPVAERLPSEPMVIQPLERIGSYGGTFRTGTIGPEIGGFPAESLRWENIIQVASDTTTLIPNIVKGWEFNDDLSAITFTLRAGMKWSDGAPFSADDFLFWYEDVILDDELTPAKPRVLAPGGNLFTVTKLDDLTIRWEFPTPYPAVLSIVSARDAFSNPISGPYAPRHFLEQFHAGYNANADSDAKAAGYDSWNARFAFIQNYSAALNTSELPLVHPWVLSEVDDFGNKHYVRNPYYWKVDSAGNQLPYVDGITKLLFENREVLDLKIVSGEIDIASRNLPVANFTLYKNGEQDGDYRVILGDGVRGSASAVQINQTVMDPVKREVFQNEQFKQAMSLAIDRQEMNDLLFFGRGTPRQTTTIPSTSFYEDWMGEYYAEYDLERANRMLDEIGLAERDGDGFRLLPDGRTFTILIETGPWENYPKIAEMIAGYWNDAGIKATAKTIAAGLAGQKVRANESEAQLQGFANVSELQIHGNASRFTPPWIRNARPWSTWIATNGASGEEPPPVVKQIVATADAFRATVPGSEEYMRLGRELLDLNVRGLYAIGTVGLEPMPVVIKNYVRNVPSGGIIAWDYYFWTPYQASTFFIDN